MIPRLLKRDAEAPEAMFWRWVQLHLPDPETLDRTASEFSRKARAEIARYCADLVVEISQGPDNLPEIVISADGLSENFPEVVDLVSKAPQSGDFRAVAFRQRHPIPKNYAIPYQRGEELGLDDVWFAIHKLEGIVNLDLYVHGIAGRNSDKIKSACFVLLDRLLGEYVVATKIGPIEWYALPADPVGLKLRPALELPQAIRELTSLFKFGPN